MRLFIRAAVSYGIRLITSVIPGRATRIGALRRPGAGSGANLESRSMAWLRFWIAGSALRAVPE